MSRAQPASFPLPQPHYSVTTSGAHPTSCVVLQLLCTDWDLQFGSPEVGSDLSVAGQALQAVLRAWLHGWWAASSAGGWDQFGGGKPGL